MNDDDCKKVEMIAEIKVRRFFDHYLNVIFPKQLTAMITAHNLDVTAHSQQIKEAVRTESLRTRLLMLGMIFIGGLGGGLGISKVIGLFVRG